MASEDFTMWSYWKDRSSVADAFETHYPSTMKENIQLQLALAQIRAAELVIDTFMKQKQEEAES